MELIFQFWFILFKRYMIEILSINLLCFSLKLLADNTCPSDWKQYGNLCIGLIKSYMTFDDARQYCQAFINGDLVVIDSHEKEIFIEKYVVNMEPRSNWIGLKDVKGNDDKSSHIWLPTGQSVAEIGYSNWRRSEPNNDSHLCVILYMNSKPEWRDRHCSSEYYFLCEKGKIPD